MISHQGADDSVVVGKTGRIFGLGVSFGEEKVWIYADDREEIDAHIANVRATNPDAKFSLIRMGFTVDWMENIEV